MDKRKPKGEIRFHIILNQEQKEAKSTILNNKISVLVGKAGSGKTLLAAQIALDMLFRGDVSKIILTRPTVSTEEIGFLPGTLEEKLEPYLAPIYDNMDSLYNKEKVDSCIKEGKITVIPFAFLRGHNFSDCVVVCDESQNITHTQMKLLLGRLCIGSKLILCGDTDQIDLKDSKLSGFEFVCEKLKDLPGMVVIRLLTNHRDPIVEEILKVYTQYEK